MLQHALGRRTADDRLHRVPHQHPDHGVFRNDPMDLRVQLRVVRVSSHDVFVEARPVIIVDREDLLPDLFGAFGCRVDRQMPALGVPAHPEGAFVVFAVLRQVVQRHLLRRDHHVRQVEVLFPARQRIVRPPEREEGDSVRGDDFQCGELRVLLGVDLIDKTFQHRLPKPA